MSKRNIIIGVGVIMLAVLWSSSMQAGESKTKARLIRLNPK